MNVMTKRGQQDNVITYEHICDTANDLKNIKPEYITLGSTAVVLQDESGFQVYMANSKKEWTPLVVSGGASEQSSSLSIHICSNEEIDENGLPAIEAPQENELYLTPAADSSAGNLYDEYIYVNNAYEKFGSGAAAITQAQSDWNQNDSTATDYIKNRICYEEEEVLYETTIDLTQYTPVKYSNGLLTYNIPLGSNLELELNQIIPKIKLGNKYYDSTLVMQYYYSYALFFGANERLAQPDDYTGPSMVGVFNSSTQQREWRLNVPITVIEDSTQPLILTLYDSYSISQIDPKWIPNRVNSNFTVKGGSLTLGSTTISEAQLQSLLALINTNSGS